MSMPRPKVLVTSTPTMVRGAGETASSPDGRCCAAHPRQRQERQQERGRERRIQPPRVFRQEGGGGCGGDDPPAPWWARPVRWCADTRLRSLAKPSALAV